MSDIVASGEKKQEIFHTDPSSPIKLHTGEEVYPVKITWGVESRAFRIVGRVLRTLPHLAKLDFAHITPADLVTTVFPSLLESAPDAVTELTAVLLGKYKEGVIPRVADLAWVEEHLDTADIVRVILPFSKVFSGKLADLIAQLPQPVGKAQS